jgi:signal transduction histidine kinase
MTALATTPIALDAPAGQRRSTIGADELAELLSSFTAVTERLQATHAALQSQVAALQGELAEANEQLSRSRELAALGEMAAGIAHEIRNPLGSIALDVGMLREDLAGRPAQREICERVGRAVERLDGIVGDVLRFARDLRLQPVEAPIEELIEATLASCEASIRRAGVTVECGPVAEGSVRVDRQLIVQALVNIVRNAAEAVGESRRPDGTLRISVRRGRRAVAGGRRAEHVVFRIEDNGPGIPEELIERIFHPFFTTRGEGTGLGLAIVHRIVDAHGGSIAVQNLPGGGARFDLAVPLRRTLDGLPQGHGLQEAVNRRIGALSGRGAG